MTRTTLAEPDLLHRPDVWDATAADYAEMAEPFTRQFAQQALVLAGGVLSGERVLDVAAGTGALTLLAARAGARVLATDFSPGMVAYLDARLRAEGWAGSGCEARVMDGQALDLADRSFDAVFSVFGVMLFPDWARGLAELARVVRPEGRAVVAVWSDPEGAGPAPLLLGAVRSTFPDRPVSPSPSGMERLADRGQFASEMTRAGLHDIAVHTVSGIWSAPSATWVADNADRLFRHFPVYQPLSEAERGRVRESLRDTLREIAGDGEVRLTSQAHVAVGRRP